MKTKPTDNAKLGLFILGGALFIILTLYMIGKNRNLLGSTFTIRAQIANVNGLVPGNNVRFKGIDVGTVKSIDIANDSIIYLVMVIDERMRPYIRNNAVVSVGTDGLMGNKLVNINSMPGSSRAVEKDDILLSQKPVETDEMLRTLNTTNENIERITHNLYEITVKLNKQNSLWTLLSDTTITEDLKMAVTEFRGAGENANVLTSRLSTLATRLQQGDGLAQRLFTDTTLTRQLTTSLAELQTASRHTSQMMQDLKVAVDHVQQGEGTAGLLLRDTLMRESLFKSAISIEQGTDRFNQNMEALKSNFLFRRYFRRLEKQKAKESGH